MPREPRFDRPERRGLFLGDFLMLKPFITPAKLRILWYAALLYGALRGVQVVTMFVGNIRFIERVREFMSVNFFNSISTEWAAFNLLLVLLGIAAVRLVLGLAGAYLARHSEHFRAAE